MKPTTDETQLLSISNRQDWRFWLKQHYHTEKEVWLVFYKKHTGILSLQYNEAVEEA